MTPEEFKEAIRYQSPIEVIQGEITAKIEGEIMTAIQHYDIRVDKEELIKALQYDRKQYEQGWRDAEKTFKRTTAEWVGSTSSASRIICTHCGTSVDFTKIDFVLRYCPNCGAIMSLPEEEDDEE